MVISAAHLLAGFEIQKEVPGDDVGFVPATEGLQRPAQRYSLRLIGGVEPRDAVIEARPDDSYLLFRRGEGVIAQLLDERVPAQHERHLAQGLRFLRFVTDL